MFLSPLDTLNTARRAVPVVDFALGAAGIAAAAAIVVGFLGYSRATFIIFGGMFIAMLLLIICSRLLSVRSGPILAAGIAMVWAVALFFITFLVFTATAVAMKWPNVWAALLLGDPPIAATGITNAAGTAVCAASTADDVEKRRYKMPMQYILEHGTFLYPLVAMKIPSGLLVLDGNHRMAAFYGLQLMPDEFFDKPNRKKATLDHDAWIGTHRDGEIPLT